MARTVRGEVLSLKEREFVVAARAQGASAARVLLRHLLRNTVHLIVVRATLDVGPIILTEATLELPGSRRAAADAVVGRPDRRLVPVPPERARAGGHPVRALSATILALNFVGEGAAEAMDPGVAKASVAVQ